MFLAFVLPRTYMWYLFGMAGLIFVVALGMLVRRDSGRTAETTELKD